MQRKYTDSIKTIVQEYYAFHGKKRKLRMNKNIWQRLQICLFGPQKHCSGETSRGRVQVLHRSQGYLRTHSISNIYSVFITVLQMSSLPAMTEYTHKLMNEKKVFIHTKRKIVSSPWSHLWSCHEQQNKNQTLSVHSYIYSPSRNALLLLLLLLLRF